jgi:hypothetical protein
MDHSNNVISTEKSTGALWARNAMVVKVYTWLMGMQLPVVWKYCTQHRSRPITEEKLRVVTVLLNRQIGDVNPTNSPKTGGHKRLGSNVVLDLSRDIIARHTSFRGWMKFQSESTLVFNDKSLRLSFLLASKICNNPNRS